MNEEIELLKTLTGVFKSDMKLQACRAFHDQNRREFSALIGAALKTHDYSEGYDDGYQDGYQAALENAIYQVRRIIKHLEKTEKKEEETK